MADSPEAIKKQVRLFYLVGAILFVMTVVTVAVATVPQLDFGAHGFDTADMVIGLLIAAFKASLVTLIFMHFWWDCKKKLLSFFFGSAIFFAIALFALTAFAYLNPIQFEAFFSK